MIDLLWNVGLCAIGIYALLTSIGVVGFVCYIAWCEWFDGERSTLGYLASILVIILMVVPILNILVWFALIEHLYYKWRKYGTRN